MFNWPGRAVFRANSVILLVLPAVRYILFNHIDRADYAKLTEKRSNSKHAPQKQGNGRTK